MFLNGWKISSGFLPPPLEFRERRVDLCLKTFRFLGDVRREKEECFLG